MGFFTGRATFLRYRVDGPAPKLFGPEHLEKLAARAIGQRTSANTSRTVLAGSGWESPPTPPTDPDLPN